LLIAVIKRRTASSVAAALQPQGTTVDRGAAGTVFLLLQKKKRLVAGAHNHALTKSASNKEVEPENPNRLLKIQNKSISSNAGWPSALIRIFYTEVDRFFT